MDGFEDDKGHKPTLSAGLAVSHHIEPMSDALALARQAEKAAKSVKDKNALAVTVSKRSGADVTVSGHWGQIDTRLVLFAGLHEADAIPDGAAYDLRDLALRFTLPPLATEAELAQAENFTEPQNELETMRWALGQGIGPEAIRILRRKRGQRGHAEIPEDMMASFEARLREEAMPEKMLPWLPSYAGHSGRLQGSSGWPMS